MNTPESKPFDLWNPHTSWGGLVITAGARVSNLGRLALKKAGLSHLSFGRIGALSLMQEAPVTQAALCAALKQKPPSMMELLARLQKEGLVKSAPDENDRRKTNWSLTAKGKKDLDKARDVLRRSGLVIDAAFKKIGVTQTELKRLKEVMEAFNRELANHKKET